MKEEEFLKNCSYNFVQFYHYTKKYCDKHNKKITIVDKENLNYGGKCNGWCDGNEMVVAYRSILFEEVYCHEFSHIVQCSKNIPLWNSTFNWETLKNKRTLLKNWPKFFDIIQLERDCEARTLQYSKKYNLFNPKQYGKRANIYLYFYQYVFLKQKWIDSQQLFQSDLIYRRMPQQLARVRDLQRIDMNLMQLYDDVIYGRV